MTRFLKNTLRSVALVTGSSVALSLALATPAAAQHACEVSVINGPAGATASGNKAFACGISAKANGENSTALGTEAVAGAKESTAIGSEASAQFPGATAVGYNAHALGHSTVAIGKDANSSASGAVTLGYYARATAHSGVALGRAAQANGLNSVAIGGDSSNGNFANSVALGAATVNTSDMQVAVGGRTLSQLANAALDAASTDAVTGQQLFATNQQVSALQLQVASLGGDGGGFDATALLNQLSDHDMRLATAESNLGTITTSVAGATQTLSNHGTRLDALESWAAGGGGGGLDPALYEQVASHTEEIASIQTTTETHTVEIAELQTVSSGHTTQIASLQTSQATQAGHIAALQNVSTAQASQISALDTRLDAVESMLHGLDVDLRRLDSKIEGSTALAIAMSGNGFLPGKTVNVTGNLGYYQGALAGSLQVGVRVSPSAAVNAGVASNFNRRGGVGARAGFTFGW